MNIKTLAAALCALVLFAALPAFAQNPTSPRTDDFVRDASAANLFEILSSQLALDKASRPEVKDFAQQMVTDHTKAGNDMKQALQMSHTDLTAAEALDDKHAQLLDGLKAVSKEGFDDLYIKDQVQAHDEAVALFGDYADEGDNDELRTFAENTLPALKRHKDMIGAIAKK